MAGWTSSNLGSNVASSYTQYDNLRTDLITGKFWDTGGTLSMRVSHDGTDGVLEASAGKVKLKAASGIYYTYNSAGTQYVKITNSGTSANAAMGPPYDEIGNSNGYFAFLPTTGAVYVGTAGQDNFLACVSISGYSTTISTASGTCGIQTTHSGSSLKLRAGNSVVTVQNTTGAQARFQMYDNGLAANVYCWPSGGTWVINSA